MMNLDFSGNKDKVAIVCVGYNRIKSLSRLLNSLLCAEYPNSDIPLVISIDCSGDQELYNYVREFKWPYGNKYVNIQEVRLGLKNHIYQCGDLTKYFKAIILLEDDLVVSPVYYSYVIQSLNMYSEESRIAEISLYKNERNGYVGLPFVNEQNGSDVFLMQDVSTWGECWTKQMWNDFTAWRDSHSEEDIQNVDMPSRIKGWTRAWSKYYNAYVVCTGKYVLYPNVSLTTNFSDAGEHGGTNPSVVQVNLQQRDFVYRMLPFSDLVKYDIYFNNELLYEMLKIDRKDLCLDLYGFHDNVQNCRYVLSTKRLPYSHIAGYALHMRPLELNIKYDIVGNDIILYDTNVPAAEESAGSYTSSVVPYFLAGFDIHLLFAHIKTVVIKTLKRKVGLK